MSRGATLKGAAACHFAGYHLPAAGRSPATALPRRGSFMSASTSAPGAVQLSSPPVVPTSPPDACLAVPVDREPVSDLGIHSKGAAVSTRSVMNMLVSTAIAGIAVPATAAEADPIFAAIEAHKAARGNDSRLRPTRGMNGNCSPADVCRRAPVVTTKGSGGKKSKPRLTRRMKRKPMRPAIS